MPGAPGRPAFSLTRRDPSPIPILIAVPHAGRVYPDNLLERMRSPGEAAIKLEDRYVDLLAGAIARETGASLLIAHAPRAMIDLNRAVEEMDWDMLRRGAPPGRGSGRVGRRARSGLGLVPRRLPGIGELWKARIEESELDARIEGIHRPYHAAIEECLRRIRDRWGAALLIDLHSMPPLSARGTGEPAPEFVLGDRFGASCDGALCAAAFDEFNLQSRRAAHNRPYAGGYVLDRHAALEWGLHAVQIEICRSTYLDARLAEPSENRGAVVATLIALVRRLAVEVAALGRSSQLPQAAE
ncbi:MAG: N-formylglutamate amidohydrolase [Novosphingobium sp.]|nr:N-formylglutamate amidohydrolase [Novosphingobium sp.]